MSEEQVDRVLNLERRFEDKPVLKKILVSGEVSANKLAKIASIATSENQVELAGLVRKLPCRALETLVRDEKIHSKENVHVNTKTQQKLLDVNSDENLLTHLDADLQKDLMQRQQKGIDINLLLRNLLKKHDEELAQEKEKLAEEVRKKNNGRKPSRYIPVAIRHHLHSEHGTKCTMPTCQKPSNTIHHTQRFALSQNHDPRFMASLCAEHHQIAHSIDIKYQMKRL